MDPCALPYCSFLELNTDQGPLLFIPEHFHKTYSFIPLGQARIKFYGHAKAMLESTL